MESTQTTEPAGSAEAHDPVFDRIIEALEQIRAEEFDYEILNAASEVMGEDVMKNWRPSLSYLPPEKQGDEYHVTIYAQGACESCPVKRSHLDSLEPKLKALSGLDNLVVHDYFDMWDTVRTPMYGDG